LNRAALERVMRPVLHETVTAARAVVRDAGLTEADIAGWFLAGGLTATPLVATMLHDAIGRPPVVLRQPRHAVPFGALQIAGAARDNVESPDLVFVNAVPSYEPGVGAVTSTYYVSVSPPEAVIRWYRGQLGDHIEHSTGEWCRQRPSDKHRVVVSSVD